MVGKGIGLVGNPNLSKQFHGGFRRFFLTLLSDEFLSQVHIVQHGQVGKEIEKLKHHAYFLSNLQAILLVVVKGYAVNDNSSAVNVFKTVKASKQG